MHSLKSQQDPISGWESPLKPWDQKVGYGSYENRVGITAIYKHSIACEFKEVGRVHGHVFKNRVHGHVFKKRVHGHA